MKTIKEIAERIYSLNAQISLKWIGMRQQPKEPEISDLNKILGEVIKNLREIDETSEKVWNMKLKKRILNEMVETEEDKMVRELRGKKGFDENLIRKKYRDSHKFASANKEKKKW